MDKNAINYIIGTANNFFLYYSLFVRIQTTNVYGNKYQLCPQSNLSTLDKWFRINLFQGEHKQIPMKMVKMQEIFLILCTHLHVYSVT